MTVQKNQLEKHSSYHPSHQKAIDTVSFYAKCSFFDILAFVFNKPNMAFGGSLVHSLVHSVLVIFGGILLLFYHQIRLIWDCYVPLYGRDYTPSELIYGACDLSTPPNIGAYSHTEPITQMSFRAIVLLVIGAVMLFAAIADYVYTYIKITYAEKNVVTDDAIAIANKLKLRIPAIHWYDHYGPFKHYRLSFLFWWYLDIIAYLFNIPNQVTNHQTRFTITRISLNAWSFLVWPFLCWLLVGVADDIYYTGILIPQIFSVCLYLGGMLELTHILSKDKPMWILIDLQHRYPKKTITLDEVTRCYNEYIVELKTPQKQRHDTKKQ